MIQTLILSGLLAGLVNLFVNYLELPFPKADSLNENEWPKPRTFIIAIIGYSIVGIAGAFLTPLIDAIVNGLKGIYDISDPKNPKLNELVLFGYGLVFGYSTSSVLVSLLNSIIKKIDRFERNIQNLETKISSNKIQINANAQSIIDECEAKFEAHKSDCSGFVKAVASEFSITLTGQADDIVDQIIGTGWTRLTDGVDAKNKADAGWFVVGGLKSIDNVPPQANGHVVIVVSGPLAHAKYPSG